MKRKSIYLFILAGLIALSGCLDDKNNYDYTDINELEGEITGMKDEYSISYSEDLTITPAFKFTIDREIRMSLMNGDWMEIYFREKPDRLVLLALSEGAYTKLLFLSLIIKLR